MNKNIKDEVIIHLSDIHYGEKVNLPHNNYSVEIAKKRLIYFFSQITDIIKSMSESPETCHIFLTGDIVHNETMRGSAKMYADCNITEQIFNVTELLYQCLQILAGSVNQIKIYGVRGNHGRIGKIGEEDDDSNFDNMVYKLLDHLTQNLSNISVENAGGFSVDVKINGWDIHAEHLDSIRSVLGLPYYGIARRKDSVYKSVHGNMRYCLGGHFHRFYDEDDGCIRTIICPSMVGLNHYSIRFGAGNIVGQNFYVINKKHGIVVTRMINCSHIQKGD